MAFVTNCADNNIPGKAANHVKMKPKGSGNCMGQEERKVNQKKIKEYISQKDDPGLWVVTGDYASAVLSWVNE